MPKSAVSIPTSGIVLFLRNSMFELINLAKYTVSIPTSGIVLFLPAICRRTRTCERPFGKFPSRRAGLFYFYLCNADLRGVDAYGADVSIPTSGIVLFLHESRRMC